MPELQFQRALHDSVQEVLEKMFFVEALDEPPDQTESQDGDMAVELSFEGAPSGALTLRVSSAAARQIAADFLGQDESGLSSAQVGEVVCELANMICGSVLSRSESTTTFRLAAPRLLLAEEGRISQEAADRRATHAVAIGSGTLSATLETRDPVWPQAEESAF
jgi:CheY-specific phosphatase CheX